MMFSKKSIRRRRLFNLKNGFILEIGWHYGKKSFIAEYTAPDGRWGLTTSNNIRDLFGRTRLGIAEIANPQIRAVGRKFGL